MDTVENVLFLLVGTALGYLAKQLKQECGAAPTAKTRITPKMPRITQRAGRLA